MKKLLIAFSLLSLLAVSTAVETGSSCISTDDCPVLHTCIQNAKTLESTCVHKELFPITAREVIGSLVIITLNAFLTAGGVGAGAAYVPYIILLLSKTLQDSIYIGYLCVFGGGLGNLINIITLRNPKTNRFMINYNVNMIVLPALMVGVMVGMILNRMLPPMVTNIILLLVLAYSFYKNFGKLKANLAKERKEQKERKEKENVETLELAKINMVTETGRENLETEKDEKDVIESAKEKVEKDQPDQDGSPEKKPLTHIPPEKMSTPAMNLVVKESDINIITEVKPQDPLAEKRELLYQKEQKYPFHKLRELLLNIVVIIVVGLIRGSKYFEPVVGVEWTCGWDFLWFGIAIGAYSLLLIRNICLVITWQKEKQTVGYEFLPEEPVFGKSRFIRLVLTSTFAGIIGAIVALGGSMIVGPTLLDFGMPPAFSAATTGVFMIFSMFNTTFTTILNDKVTGAEIAWFLSLAFVFSFTSSKIVNWYVKKTGKQSTIIKMIMLVGSLGFICLLAILIQSLVEDFEKETKFKPIC